jgi:hypothetical protein
MTNNTDELWVSPTETTGSKAPTVVDHSNTDHRFESRSRHGNLCVVFSSIGRDLAIG